MTIQIDAIGYQWRDEAWNVHMGQSTHISAFQWQSSYIHIFPARSTRYEVGLEVRKVFSGDFKISLMNSQRYMVISSQFSILFYQVLRAIKLRMTGIAMHVSMFGYFLHWAKLCEKLFVAVCDKFAKHNAWLNFLCNCEMSAHTIFLINFIL